VDSGVGAESVGRGVGEKLLERTSSVHESDVLMKRLDRERVALERIDQKFVTVCSIDDSAENASRLGRSWSPS
jgi:hypothetical protein